MGSPGFEELKVAGKLALSLKRTSLEGLTQDVYKEKKGS